MSNYDATVIKTGNSLALRVPKQYVQASNLMPGDKVKLALPIVLKEQNRTRIVDLIEKLQNLRAYASIEDPMLWQRTMRQDRSLPDRD